MTILALHSQIRNFLIRIIECRHPAMCWAFFFLLFVLLSVLPDTWEWAAHHKESTTDFRKIFFFDLSTTAPKSTCELCIITRTLLTAGNLMSSRDCLYCGRRWICYTSSCIGDELRQIVLEKVYRISQGCQTQFLEGRSPAEFSSKPAPTQIPCSYQINLNDLISWIRRV